MEDEVTGVVYKLTCLICKGNNLHSSYIGETGRPLVRRLKEHFRTTVPGKFGDDSTSQVKIHAMNVHGANNSEAWNVEILGRSEVTQERRIIEAMAIRDHKPNLNANNGLSLII